jgi:hypothetical protein
LVAHALIQGSAKTVDFRPMRKKTPQRCNARIRHSTNRLDRAVHSGRVDEYLRRSGHWCRNWAVRGSKRCRYHGGYSTGPTTFDGMARTIAAMKAGRARWLAELKTSGKPIPFGRKKGGRNVPAAEREQVAYEKRCERAARKLSRQSWVERKVRRVREREETRRKMEEHARRKVRADAGGPYWTEDEWETL